MVITLCFIHACSDGHAWGCMYIYMILGCPPAHSGDWISHYWNQIPILAFSREVKEGRGGANLGPVWCLVFAMAVGCSGKLTSLCSLSVQHRLQCTLQNKNRIKCKSSLIYLLSPTKEKKEHDKTCLVGCVDHWTPRAWDTSSPSHILLSIPTPTLCRPSFRPRFNFTR